MKLWHRYTARRQRKSHEAYVKERERQKELNARDAQVAMRDVADSSAFATNTFSAQ